MPAMELLPPIPNDPRVPNRPTQTIKMLTAFVGCGGIAGHMQITLSLLMPPLNLRFFLAALDNLRRLKSEFPSAFSRLNSAQKEALQYALSSYEMAAQIEEPGLTSDIRRSPRSSGHGNLRYSTTRHPAYSLLMLDHPHPATAVYFDLMVAEVIAKAISLRSGFAWAAYVNYIHPDSREQATCPQPLNGSIEGIERAARQLTGSTRRDHLAFLTENNIPTDIDTVLDCLAAQATQNTHSKEAVELGRLVRNFIEATPSENQKNFRKSWRRGFRRGLNYGTHRIGPFEVTATQMRGASLIRRVSDQIRKEALETDAAPYELADPMPTLMLDLGTNARLPVSSKDAISRQMMRQISRSQQLMPNRISGLKQHKLIPVSQLISANDLPVHAHLLLIASLATGRPIDSLKSISITTGARLTDAIEDIEYDLVRRAWRVRINLPELKNHQAPKGAKVTASHAELPDAFGAHRLASSLRENKKKERLTITWTEAHYKSAYDFLKTHSMSESYLSRILPMALFESTGDLSTGALISSWLPNDCETYLHYLTVDTNLVAKRYLQGVHYLKDRFHLPLTPPSFEAQAGHVGMPNCPDDFFIKHIVCQLITQIEDHPILTRKDRAHYINLLSTYSLLFMTQGLGLRNWIDSDPNIQPLPPEFDGMGIATFSDKAVTDGHFRVIYCPADLTEHMAGITGLAQRIQSEFPALNGIEAPGLLAFIDENGRARRFHPSDVKLVLGESFDFMPNALRRRARSYMYEYQGEDAPKLAHGYSCWMGHWPYSLNPHRIEADGLRESLYMITQKIIDPLLASDGWRPLTPRI